MLDCSFRSLVPLLSPNPQIWDFLEEFKGGGDHLYELERGGLQKVWGWSGPCRVRETGESREWIGAGPGNGETVPMACQRRTFLGTKTRVELLKSSANYLCFCEESWKKEPGILRGLESCCSQEAFLNPWASCKAESSTDLVFGLTWPSLPPHNNVPMDRWENHFESQILLSVIWGITIEHLHSAVMKNQ